MQIVKSLLATAALVLGSAAVAAAQQGAPTTAPAQAHGQRFGRRGGDANRALFRGMQLSDAEKANIKNVETKYSAQQKSLRQQMAPQMEAMRAARQRGDTAAMRSLREQNKPQREAARKQETQLMQAERNDLRGALSADNQAKFDANAKQLKNRFAQRAGRGFNRRPGE